MENENEMFEEYASDSLEDIVHERKKNKALRKMLPVTFGDSKKDNTRYYIINNLNDGSAKRDLLDDDSLENLEKAYSGKALETAPQNLSNGGFVGSIKRSVKKVVEPIKKVIGHRYVKEGAFALSHPVVAVATGPNVNGAPNISSVVTRFAESGKVLGTNSESTDEASEKGAMRHALWQATLTALFGDKIATKIGNAHEDGLNYDVSVRQYKNLSDADKTVDLLNNIEGRRIAAEFNGLCTPKRMALCVLKDFKENGLYIAVQGNDGYWHIERRKLDEDKYNRILQEYQKMNFLGY